LILQTTRKKSHFITVFSFPARSFVSNDSHDAGGGLFGNPNTVGWHVITPFILEGRDESILVSNPILSKCKSSARALCKKFPSFKVNRGWIPKNNKSPSTRLSSQIKETIDLVGVVRKADTRQQFTPKNTDPDGILWSYKYIKS